MTASFTSIVAAYFQAHPGEWIRAERLQDIGGRFAFRTRISDCRLQFHMTIENRLSRVLVEFPRWHTVTVSEYRYVPVKAGQQELGL